MKRYLVWIFLAAAAFGQRSTTSLTAANQCAQISVNLNSSSTVTIQVSGTWVATLQPQVAINGRAATNTSVAPKGSTTLQSTIAANGVFSGDAAGVELFQVCATAYTSGTAVVDLTVTTGIATNLLGGGGGAGAVSSVFGRTGAVTATSGDYTAAQVTNAVATNASNIFTAGLQDFSGAGVTMEIPEAAGFTANVNSTIGLDTTANIVHLLTNGADSSVCAATATDTTTTHAMFATAVAGICNARAIAAGDLPSTVVLNNAANAFTAAGTLNLNLTSPTAGFILPVAAGAAPTTAGAMAYNSTSFTPVIAANGLTFTLAMAAAGGTSNTTCSNQFLSAVSGNAAPTCTTVTAAMVTNAMVTNSGNTGAAGWNLNASAATGVNALRIPVQAGCTAAGATGDLCYDSTAAFTHEMTSGVDSWPASVLAKVSNTAQTASLGTTTLCTAAQCPTVGGGYEVHWNFWGSGTACSSVTAGSVTFNMTWTDENAVTHTAVALQMMGQTGAATMAMGSTFPFQTALANESASGSFKFSTNGTIIQYSTTYVACTTGTGTWNLRAEVVRLQ